MPNLTQALDEWLDRSPRIALGLSLAVLALVGLFHLHASPEYHIDVFYLVPVAMAARYGGRWGGPALSVLAAATWFVSDYWSYYPNHLWLPEWSVSSIALSLVNASLCLVIFIVISLLVSRLESDVVREKALAKTKSEMLSIVSHEFSNALTTMGMAIFILEEEMGDEPSAHQVELYDVLHRNITSLKREVENLLNEARMESGRFALDIRAVNAAESARTALATLESAARQKKLEVVLDLPSAPLEVRADPDALHLVLANLIGNAVKYTPAGGRVTIGLRTSGEPALIATFCVEDTGIGMDETEQKDAMLGFTRTSRGKKMAAGFGLGLKTARDMLASHGARLVIESRQGGGSRFSFSLPIVQDRKPRPK